MHSTRPPEPLEERLRNHLKLVSNIILAIMRLGCLILTATILRSSIRASRRKNTVHFLFAQHLRISHSAHQPLSPRIEELLQPRSSFKGHDFETPWTDLQLAYFVRCAMWTYMNTSFLLEY